MNILFIILSIGVLGIVNLNPIKCQSSYGSLDNYFITYQASAFILQDDDENKPYLIADYSLFLKVRFSEECESYTSVTLTIEVINKTTNEKAINKEVKLDYFYPNNSFIDALGISGIFELFCFNVNSSTSSNQKIKIGSYGSDINVIGSLLHYNANLVVGEDKCLNIFSVQISQGTVYFYEMNTNLLVGWDIGGDIDIIFNKLFNFTSFVGSLSSIDTNFPLEWRKSPVLFDPNTFVVVIVISAAFIISFIFIRKTLKSKKKNQHRKIIDRKKRK